MRPYMRMGCLVSILVLVSGCPWNNPEKYQFTSADTSWRGGGLFDNLAPGDTSTDIGAEGEAEQREVVEPDVIRRDGALMYVLNQYRGLTIVDLDQQVLLAQVPTYGYPRDLYLVGDRAYVLVGYAQQYIAEGNSVGFTIGSRLYVLDVSDPAEATILSSLDLDGDFIDSRLVGEVLYAVSAEFEWSWEDGVVVGSSVAKQQTSESWVTSVDVSNPADVHVVDHLSFDGYGNVIQATADAIFVAASTWFDDTTTITYVDISDPAGAIVVRGSIPVEGYVADRFKMDVWNGVLRVVSNTGWSNRNVYVTTVDLADPDNLAVLGETTIEDAAGETLFATRFDGPRAYIVTYLVVDPLFVLDLSDPANPVLAGALTVPGWSTHIEPQGDRLIALGVDDTEERRVCVSLFDVADPANPALLDRESFGEGWSWSSAYNDVKALTVLEDMILVPFSGWHETGNFDRLQFISYTHDTLELQGYVDLQGEILRSFEYGGLYFGVTQEQLATIDAGTPGAPKVINRLTLAEYIADYQEISAEVGVEIISHFDDGATVVRTVAGDGTPLGETAMVIGNLCATHVYGNTLVLVATNWDEDTYQSSYMVALVDCTTPENPQATSLIPVDVEPFWSYWYYDWLPIYAWREGGGMRDKSANTSGSAKLWAPWWWGPTGDATFLLGDRLVLRCQADTFDVVFGDATPYQGVAVLDLGTATGLQTIGFGYNWIESLDAAGDKLYLGTKESAGTDLLGRGLCAHYLREFDPEAPAMGPAANVPGTFLQYNPATQVLVLKDSQYDVWWDVARSLQSVTWDGGDDAKPINVLALPENTGTVLGRGGRIYFEQYDEATVVGSIEVSAAGVMTIGERAKVTDDWAYILDAKDASVYVVVEGGALARYDFSDEPQLADLLPMMSGPLRMRFGAAAAYAPLGYAGLAVLPL